jgi:predicted signal transduction protein with EAL and GGDEF domain
MVAANKSSKLSPPVFPFDKIKIDRSFVKEFVERTDCVAIVRAISGLGRSRQGRAYLHVEQHSSCCSAG